MDVNNCAKIRGMQKNSVIGKSEAPTIKQSSMTSKLLIVYTKGKYHNFKMIGMQLCNKFNIIIV